MPLLWTELGNPPSYIRFDNTLTQMFKPKNTYAVLRVGLTLEIANYMRFINTLTQMYKPTNTIIYRVKSRIASGDCRLNMSNLTALTLNGIVFLPAF